MTAALGTVGRDQYQRLPAPRLITILAFMRVSPASSSWRSLSKAPSNVIAVVLIAPPGRVDSPDASVNVPLGHGVQLLAEAALRHDHFDNVREIFLDSLRALSAFVAGHIDFFG